MIASDHFHPKKGYRGIRTCSSTAGRRKELTALFTYSGAGCEFPVSPFYCACPFTQWSRVSLCMGTVTVRRKLFPPCAMAKRLNCRRVRTLGRTPRPLTPAKICIPTFSLSPSCGGECSARRVAWDTFGSGGMHAFRGVIANANPCHWNEEDWNTARKVFSDVAQVGGKTEQGCTRGGPLWGRDEDRWSAFGHQKRSGPRFCQFLLRNVLL